MTPGISLLSLKHHLLLSYLRSLVLVSSGRALGNSLNGRSAPTQPFSRKDRDARGNQMGDLIDSMIENRAVLEKIQVLEAKMRYQIDKLMRIAEEPSTRLTDGKHYLSLNSHVLI
jgi:U3 small nucleolar ribonucleoprotein protein LCP5